MKDKMELSTIANAIYVSLRTSRGAGIQAIIFSFAIWEEFNVMMPISLDFLLPFPLCYSWGLERFPDPH